MSVVRTRFAPSPTGYMHIGNLRTALYAFLLARTKKGKFILRVEDTDDARYVSDSLDFIYKILEETGLNYDEGPNVGGEYGPYVQSERKSIYKKYIDELIKSDGCYLCFCSEDRLKDVRERQIQKKLPTKYDGHCRNLSRDEIDQRIKDGMPYVVRQRIPHGGTTTFLDEIFGEITVENYNLDDNVLLKSNGLPTYNFANVIDDHLMEITHVIRGSEYLSSTPKYNLLYKSFGWTPPIYVHVPPITRQDGKKISKRDGDASYKDLMTKGYEKEAVLNYIILLGWSSRTEREIYSIQELIDIFDIEGLGKSPAVFDEKKLQWLNGEFIRNLPFETFHERAIPYYKKILGEKSFDFKRLSELLCVRTMKFSDIPESIDFLNALPEYNISIFSNKKMKTTPENSLETLKLLFPILNELSDFSEEELHKEISNHIEKCSVKNGTVLWPLRVAISGKSFTPGGAIEFASLLGKKEALKRINIAISKLENSLDI